MLKTPKTVLLRILAEYLITVVLLCIALNFFRLFKHPPKRGFFCDDESLKYPYHKDTVDSKLLYLLSLYLPLSIITFCEGILFLTNKLNSTDENRLELKITFLKFHHNLTTFLCGFAMNALFVHLGKITVGRLRPHFFDLCKPYRRLDRSTCAHEKNYGLYIEDYECSTANMPKMGKFMLQNMHLSFPSGHSSYMFYGMIFTILYLHRFSKDLSQYRINVGLLMPVLQMSSALLAWFVAISRVVDYKHHWSDVLVGIMLGTSVAIAVSFYVRQQLKSVNIKEEDVKTITSHAFNTMTYETTMPNSIIVP